jgi:uncharacterized membrane protein YdjX (TVP38/TMEM64 family)
MWRSLSGFFVHLDAKLYRAVLATVCLLVLVGAVFLIGKSAEGQAALKALEGWMQQYQHSPLAIVIVILVFCVSALFGAPQFVLIAACVVVFGPWWGFFYSWVATMVSAAMTFYMGRFMGAGLLKKLGGDHVNRLSDYIGKNAFSASFIVRNIPSAPFIVVNMAFGASDASFSGFILGCTLGVLPKTALVALFGTSYTALTKGGNWKMALLMAALALLWLALMIGARRLYEAGKNRGG